MNKVIDDVHKELEHAKSKHPHWPNDPLHAVSVIGEEFGELTQAILQTIYEPGKATVYDVKNEAMQLAAVTIRFIMSLDKYEYNPSCQHTQND